MPQVHRQGARFVRLCDAYSIPVVTVVNTEGFGKSEGDDQAGGIRQAARMAGVYAEATTVKVAVLAGEAVGPAYTVFAACADWRVAVQGCTVAPLLPRPLSPFCTRTRSSLPITSSTPPRLRLPPTPRRSAAPMPLWPTVLLTPLPMLPPPAALSLRLWICWPASALCAWLRSTAISRCNHQP